MAKLKLTTWLLSALVSLAPDGSLVVGGNWVSNLWPVTPNAFQRAFVAGSTAFPIHAVVARFKPLPSQ